MNKYFIITSTPNEIEKLTNVLDDYPNFEYIGASYDYDEVMNTLLKESPDLVYINLNSFKKAPSEFVKELSLYMCNIPQLIALSKDTDLAYDAIKSNFSDYLLTPLNELEIRKSIITLQQTAIIKKKNTLCLKSYKDFQYLNTEDILFLKADNNTTEFHLKDGKVINAYKTLKTFQDKLPINFSRIHKSYIINTKYISRINYGKLHCTIKGEALHTIPFTKTYEDSITSIKNILSQNLVA